MDAPAAAAPGRPANAPRLVRSADFDTGGDDMKAHGSISLLTACSLLVLAGCGDVAAPQSQRPDGPAVHLSNHESPRACHAVQGEIDESGFVGVLSGDLVGTTISMPSLETILTGKATHVTGSRTWDITGGTANALVGSSFTTDFETVLTGDPPILRGNERNRASVGVRVANLTVHGTVDVSGFPPTVVADLEYRGEICP